MDKIKRILIISDDQKLKAVLDFCFDGWGYEVFFEEGEGKDLNLIKKISPHVIIIDVHAARNSDLDICRALKEDFATVSTPVITLINKRHLRAHLLYLKYGIDDYLIKPPDPLDLRIRIEMAVRRVQHSFYASSLTGLPGSRIVEDVLAERIEKREGFAFAYIDIDNFKAFNDSYGYFKGDSVLMNVAYILYRTVKDLGNKEDLIGHIGGDDFLILTTEDKCDGICERFLIYFNDIIPFHYNFADRHNGFVIAEDRARRQRKIPLMGVSVAVVNQNSAARGRNIIHINERAAEIKKFLKGIAGSKYMVDRRSSGGFNFSGPYIKNPAEKPPRKPLGQILLDKKMLSESQLEEALRLHWRRGVVFGDVLNELGLLSESRLQEILSYQDLSSKPNPV